ncbi:hypothetical protein CAC42_7476 [Sphaceloma murrayae]|uniref:Uncharacterized protein n=1 Tax=Sphaceloma murrayae TaxID=2082308 RepID=A0A2K1QX50_9PEZI|nr:hypothetical protein CAC42_7476 [Sphaceloma murrayae]
MGDTMYPIATDEGISIPSATETFGEGARRGAFGRGSPRLSSGGVVLTNDLTNLLPQEVLDKIITMLVDEHLARVPKVLRRRRVGGVTTILPVADTGDVGSDDESEAGDSDGDGDDDDDSERHAPLKSQQRTIQVLDYTSGLWDVKAAVNKTSGLLALTQTCRYFFTLLRKYVYQGLAVHFEMLPESHDLRLAEFKMKFINERTHSWLDPNNKPGELMAIHKTNMLLKNPHIKPIFLTRLWLTMSLNKDFVSSFMRIMRHQHLGDNLRVFILMLAPPVNMFNTSLSHGSRDQENMKHMVIEYCMREMRDVVHDARAGNNWPSLRCPAVIFIGGQQALSTGQDLGWIVDPLRAAEKNRLEAKYGRGCTEKMLGGIIYFATFSDEIMAERFWYLECRKDDDSLFV